MFMDDLFFFIFLNFFISVIRFGVDYSLDNLDHKIMYNRFLASNGGTLARFKRSAPFRPQAISCSCSGLLLRSLSL